VYVYIYIYTYVYIYIPFGIFTDIWDILLPLYTVCVRSVHFSGFGIMYHKKSGNPGAQVNIQYFLCAQRKHQKNFFSVDTSEDLRIRRAQSCCSEF
jgi:hypothetical protein